LGGRTSPALQCPPGQMPEYMVFSDDGYLAVARLVPVPPSAQEPIDLRPPQDPPLVLGLWERATGKLLRTWDLKFDGFVVPAFAPGGRTLLLAFAEQLQVRDLATDTTLLQIRTGPVNVVSVSPDGRRAAT